MGKAGLNKQMLIWHLT